MAKIQAATKKAEPLLDIPKCMHIEPRPSPNAYGSICSVVIGRESNQKTFQIHSGLLSHYSSYFQTALKPVWMNDKSNTIELQEENAALFQIFFHWLYSGTLCTTLTSDGKIPITEQDLCALFIFGDCRGIPELCNAAVTLIFQRFGSEWAYPSNCLNYIYDNTIGDSRLRTLFVDLAVGSFSFAQLRDKESIYPKAFLIDVIMRSRELKTWPGSVENRKEYLGSKAKEMCKYHDHRDPHGVEET